MCLHRKSSDIKFVNFNEQQNPNVRYTVLLAIRRVIVLIAIDS